MFSSYRQLLLLIEKCHLNVCLNELKFCKISRNPKSNRCWKFQLYILTNKKVLFLKKYELYQVSKIVLFEIDRWRLDVLTFLIHGFEKTHAKSLWCITWPDSATLLCTLDLSFMNLYPLLAKKCFKSCIKKLFSVLFKLKGQGQHNGLKSILNQYISWFLYTGY